MSNLKRIRMELGISQKTLAEAVGVSAPFMFDLENGNRNASWERNTQKNGRVKAA